MIGTLLVGLFPLNNLFKNNMKCFFVPDRNASWEDGMQIVTLFGLIQSTKALLIGWESRRLPTVGIKVRRLL